MEVFIKIAKTLALVAALTLIVTFALSFLLDQSIEGLPYWLLLLLLLPFEVFLGWQLCSALKSGETSEPLSHSRRIHQPYSYWSSTLSMGISLTACLALSLYALYALFTLP